MADNNRLKRTLEYDETDALMLAHAMMIASTTAWMCDHPGARERCKKYAAIFAEVVPKAARQFDGDTWAEIGMALATARSFRLDILRRPGHFDYLVVHITSPGGEETRHLSEPLRDKPEARYRNDAHDETLKAVGDVLADLAPLGCARLD